jgi:hypothetical protein
MVEVVAARLWCVRAVQRKKELILDKSIVAQSLPTRWLGAPPPSRSRSSRSRSGEAVVGPGGDGGGASTVGRPAPSPARASHAPGIITVVPLRAAC